LEAQNHALVAENWKLRDAFGLPPKEGITPEAAQDHLVSEESANQTTKISSDRLALIRQMKQQPIKMIGRSTKY
jgi:hypothetical protein